MSVIKYTLNALSIILLTFQHMLNIDSLSYCITGNMARFQLADPSSKHIGKFLIW